MTAAGPLTEATGPSAVRVVFEKWGGRPHWEYDAVRLGRDEHGTWLGAPAGTRLQRPGAAFRSELGFAVLVPDAAGFVATFYARGRTTQPEGWVEVYVDITTVPSWSGARVTMIDLDLDVVRGRSGRVWVDDEDEFALHRRRWSYPEEVVRHASAACALAHEAVTAHRTPFDGVVGPAWVTRLPGRPGVAGPGPGS